MRPDWLLLARPLIRANIALPLLLGQVLAQAATGRFSWSLLSWSVLLVVPLQLAWTISESASESGREHADEASPAHHVEVLFVGAFGPGGLRTAMALAMAFVLGAALVVGWSQDRWWTVAGVAVHAAGLWAYGFPPLQLARRPQSELLVGALMGAVAPLTGFLLQTGSVESFPWAAIFPLFLLGFVSEVTAQLPNVPADRLESRATYPVRKGEYAARRHTLELLVVSTTMTGLVVPGLPVAALIPIVAVPLGMLYANLGLLQRADADHRDQCLAFVLVNGATIQVLLLAWIIALALLALSG